MSDGVPQSWTVAHLGNFTIEASYGTSAKTTSDATGVPVLRMGNIVSGKLHLEQLKYLPSRHHEFPDLLLSPGDVLFNRTNSAELVGKTAVYRGTPAPCSFASYLIRLRVSGVLPDWVSFYLNSPFGRAAINRVVSQQVGQANVNGTKLKAFTIPVPPLNEQKRIVAKVEELFSELDAGEESLRTARRQLGVYRQSLLKQAFEGKLTATWRAKNPTTETASDLLVRIQERRKANGAPAGKPTEPVPPNEKFKGVTPDGWLVASMDALTSHITSGSRDWTQYYQEDGYAVFVMAQNVRPLRFDSTPVVRVSPPEFDRDKSRSAIRYEDLLVTIVGANTGDVCRVDHKFENYYVCQSVALLRPAEPATAAYLELYMNSQEHGQKQFQQWMYGQGRPHLSFDQLRSTAVCLPPLAEQQEIVRLLDEQFEAIEQNERELDAALQQSAALRQAILKKAFTGQLVPQDPADEPASVLLARLRNKVVTYPEPTLADRLVAEAPARSRKAKRP